MRTVPDFIFLGSKITVDGDCSHAIKTRLLLGRKAMTNLNSVLKSRDITLPTKVYVLKAMVFSVWMWELDHKEGWTPNNWCFLNCDVEKTLENLLYSKRSKQSILKEINPECSLEELMLKLKLQWPPDAKSRSTGEDRLMLRRTEGRRIGGNRGWNGWMASPIQWTWVWANSGGQWRTGKPGILKSMGSETT